MSNAEYTPGPWRVGNFTNCIVANSPNGTHCDSVNVEAYGAPLVCESVLTEANARLIAAAPELLEALESLLIYADVALENPELFGGVEAVRNLRGPAFEDAQLVVSKATGKELAA